LGATLYELLTLEPGFSGTDRNELLRQIAFEEPRAPRRWNKAIPAELETIVLKALEKNPAGRYATANELAEDLGRFLQDQQIRDWRPSLMQQARKWVRRHRVFVWSAATILAVAAVMLAGMLGWAVNDRAARRVVVEEAVNQALKDSQDWQDKRKLPEALSAALRAEGIALGGPTSERLRQKVQTRLADLR